VNEHSPRRVVNILVAVQVAGAGGKEMTEHCEATAPSSQIQPHLRLFTLDLAAWEFKVSCF